MFEPITENTIIQNGDILRQPKDDDSYNTCTVGNYYSEIDAYEIIVSGVNTGEDTGLILFSTQNEMIQNGWEIEKK